MSISYNSTDGMIISPSNPTDTTTIISTKPDSSTVNSVEISSSNTTFNVPIQIPTTIPTSNMIGYTVFSTLAADISLPGSSNAVVNVATISGLGPGTYLFKGEILCKTASGSNQTNKIRNRLAMQFNDISTSTIDTTGKYGGFNDFSTIFFIASFSSAFSFSFNVQSILNIQTTSNIYFNVIFNHNVTSFVIKSGAGNSAYTYTRIA